jgi:Double zinc ribbon
MTSTAPTCPACGAPHAGGNFCNACGAPIGPRTCRSCAAPLSPSARFCHQCGEPAAGAVPRKSENLAWIFAGAASFALVGAIIWFVTRGAPEPVTPDMANPGSVTGGTVADRAPDISQMTPQERFDRLFDRVTRAASAGDTAQVAQFTPMALGAYAQLDSISNDARFHAAMLRFNVGDFAGSLALADTIERNVPSHLFPAMIRGNVATANNDRAGLARNYQTFLANYDREMAANRVEYLDHKPVVDEFHALARQQ